MPLYFAYGSNMCMRQVLTGMDGKPARCPDAKPVGKGLLKGWRYIIYARGFANVAPDENEDVWGGVWEMTEEHLRALDGYEGVAKGLYHREEVIVELDGAGCVKCATYIDSNEGSSEKGIPSCDYQARIIEGAHDFGLPAAYIAFLGLFGENGAS